LEVMAERQATVDNVRRPLSEAFFVIATQNPIELHGTFPLPEAQLDRFAMRLRIGYPARDDELEMLAGAVSNGRQKDRSSPAAVTLEQLRAIQNRVEAVAVERPVRQYLVDIAAATRHHPQVSLGLSPRGLLTWQRLAQAWAYLNHRSFVTPDDVQAVAQPVLEVRLGIDAQESSRVIAEILDSVPVPAGV